MARSALKDQTPAQADRQRKAPHLLRRAQLLALLALRGRLGLGDHFLGLCARVRQRLFRRCLQVLQLLCVVLRTGKCT